MSKAGRPRPKSNNSIFIGLLLGAFGISFGIAYLMLSKGDKDSKPLMPATASVPQKSQSAIYKEYAGSLSCRECHQDQFNQWTNSHHGLAERLISPELDKTAFSPGQSFKHGTQTSETLVTNDTFAVLTAGSKPGREAFVPARAIGVEPLRQYLVPAEKGRLQVMEVAFDPHKKDWFDIFGDEDRQAGEWGHWTGRGMTWNTMCANCHNTRVFKNYDHAADTFATTMAEMSVGCEACHGPMKRHVDWQKKNPAAKNDPTLTQLTRQQNFETCGTCHARRGELTGNFQPGDNFFDHFSLVIPDETDIYFPDGQVRDEDYEFASFLGSKMYHADVRCMDCHNPHSGKTRLAGNDLCMMCHNGLNPKAPKIEPVAHSFHKAGSPGNDCVSCHMPLTTYMQRHNRRDHGFTIPDPLMTKEHGIPNACNRCHRDKDTDWALQAVEKWYGDKMKRPTRERAQAVANARNGKIEAVPKLMRMATDEPNAAWRGTAVTLLRRWTDSPAVRSTILKAAQDSEPLVRAMAARALDVFSSEAEADAALHKLLDDPSRAVRIDAAWALHAHIDTNSVAGSELLTFMRQNLDQPSSQLQMGSFYIAQNAIPEAISHFRRAIEIDSHSAPSHHALAVALSLNGDSAGAVKELRAACNLDKQNAEYQFKLGLALNESGQLSEATAALETAVKLDPAYAQAWYNLGLAYNTDHRADRAIEMIEKAEGLARNPLYPYARATILARQGRMDEARGAAKTALSIDPNYSDAAALLQQLQR